MATTMTSPRGLQIVHPLDNIAKEKRSPAGLGEMPMSASVRVSLHALRGCLILIGLRVGSRVLSLAGVFGHHVP